MTLEIRLSKAKNIFVDKKKNYIPRTRNYIRQSKQKDNIPQILTSINLYSKHYGDPRLSKLILLAAFSGEARSCGVFGGFASPAVEEVPCSTEPSCVLIAQLSSLVSAARLIL